MAAAYQVRDRWPAADAGRSLSIPTWFYGHEPTNPFATMIAKYFANALREDTLLHRCRGGIVFFPGQAGTVQEIFQAVTENFYAAGPTLVAPMILVGVDYWTAQLPAWPLLQRLGAGRAMGEVIHCVDDVASVPGCSPTRRTAIATPSFSTGSTQVPASRGPDGRSRQPIRRCPAMPGCRPEGERMPTTKKTIVAAAAGVMALGAGIGVASLASADPTPSPTPSATTSGTPTRARIDRVGAGATAARTTRIWPRNWPASSG